MNQLIINSRILLLKLLLMLRFAYIIFFCYIIRLLRNSKKQLKEILNYCRLVVIKLRASLSFLNDFFYLKQGRAKVLSIYCILKNRGVPKYCRYTASSKVGAVINSESTETIKRSRQSSGFVPFIASSRSCLPPFSLFTTHALSPSSVGGYQYCRFSADATPLQSCPLRFFVVVRVGSFGVSAPLHF